MPKPFRFRTSVQNWFVFACWSCIGVAQPSNSFVDSKQCGTCHASVADHYRHTGMARSFYRLGQETSIEDFTKGRPFYHSPTGAYYAMSSRDGRYFQSRWQVDSAGAKINFEEWRIDYVMGSGNHVRTYLHRGAGGTLSELPLAWYSEKGGYWAMNPGYDAEHFIAPRKIAYECMFCHNAYPRIPAGHERPNSVPAYLDPLPEGIDCQRCHGPGANHARLAQTAGARVEQIRASIVNPARLTSDRQMEICMQCHLQTAAERLPASIRRFDRGPFSYRAGEPLSTFILFFDRAPGSKPKFEIVSSVVRLRESRCFRESKGALTCLTCHDPHEIPRGPQAATHYTAVCLKCHNAALSSLIASGRHTREADCIGCHMPKRRTEDVVHAVMTDHLIERTKPSGDLLAEIRETHETDRNAYHGVVVPHYPDRLTGADSLYSAVAQVEHNSNLEQGVGQLSSAIEQYKPRMAEFYFELGEAWRSKGDAARAAAAYEKAAARDAGAAWALRRLAAALLATGERARAEDALNRAVHAAPDDARGWFALGELYAESGRSADSIAAFQKSTQLDPDLADAFNSLGSVLAETGNARAAEDAFRSALRVLPDLANAQANLGVLLASNGHVQEAADHLERAVRFDPSNATARCNYAIALAQLNRPQEAEQQLELALATDPNMAQAHLDLGILLAQRGAIPESAAHLRKAAANGNPQVRQQALQLLKQMGQ